MRTHTLKLNQIIQKINSIQDFQQIQSIYKVHQSFRSLPKKDIEIPSYWTIKSISTPKTKAHLGYIRISQKLNKPQADHYQTDQSDQEFIIMIKQQYWGKFSNQIFIKCIVYLQQRAHSMLVSCLQDNINQLSSYLLFQGLISREVSPQKYSCICKQVLLFWQRKRKYDYGAPLLRKNWKKNNYILFKSRQKPKKQKITHEPPREYTLRDLYALRQIFATMVMKQKKKQQLYHYKQAKNRQNLVDKDSNYLMDTYNVKQMGKYNEKQMGMYNVKQHTEQKTKKNIKQQIKKKNRKRQQRKNDKK